MSRRSLAAERETRRCSQETSEELLECSGTVVPTPDGQYSCLAWHRWTRSIAAMRLDSAIRAIKVW